MLRRRYYSQTQTAREAERGKEADEEHRQDQYSARGLYPGAKIVAVERLALMCGHPDGVQRIRRIPMCHRKSSPSKLPAQGVRSRRGPGPSPRDPSTTPRSARDDNEALQISFLS